MARISPLTGKDTVGWKPQPKPKPSADERMYQRLASLSARLTHLELVADIDRLKNKMVEMSATQRAEAKTYQDQLASLRQQMEAMKDQAEQLRLERDGLKNSNAGALAAAEARANALAGQIDTLEAGHRAATAGLERDLAAAKAMAKMKRSKTAAAPQAQPSAEPRPPAQITTKVAKDMNGLLSRITLSAPGYMDITINVQRGADNSIVGMQFNS